MSADVRSAWRLGLVGHPIAHSLSPVMHEAALSFRGLNGSYERFDTTDSGVLADHFAALRAGRLDGLNATVPHKLAAYAACDRHAPIALRVGAVNTIARARSASSCELVGWNTDLPGLVASIRLAWPALAPRAVLVIGAGGAAPAAVLAAQALGASDIRVYNRTSARAEALVTRLGVGQASADSRSAARDVELIIQASSHGNGLEGEALMQAEREAASIMAPAQRDACVVDLVYRPRPTAWVRAARSSGRLAIDGLEMLVQQAALAFELWTLARDEVTAASVAAADLVCVMREAANQALAMSR